MFLYAISRQMGFLVGRTQDGSPDVTQPLDARELPFARHSLTDSVSRLTCIFVGGSLIMSDHPKPMQKILVLANLGRIRFLVFKESGDDPLDQSHLLEAPSSPIEIRPVSIHQAVTDQAGRFRQGGASAQGVGMSYGEEYELEEHLESEALHRVAAKIDEIISVAGYPGWQLVAPSTILSKLQEALPELTRRCLSRCEAGDLTKIPLADLEERFL